LLSALRDLGSGCSWCLKADVLSLFARNCRVTHERFSGRHPSIAELQCGCAVSLGLTNRQIARLLHVEAATIKTHLHHLFEKLDVASRHELGTLFERALAR